MAIRVFTMMLVCTSLLVITGAGRDVMPAKPDKYAEGQARMLRDLKRHGVRDEAVMAAMATVRRHLYVPAAHRGLCDPYGDHPCPIGHGQTISQPFIVAYMTQLTQIRKGEKVLEIGTGSGYQAAVLAALGAEVYSIEIVPELAAHARDVLSEEGLSVNVLTGDGYVGWPEHAPFDVIIVTCAPANVPQALVEQLADSGRMLVPVGRHVQRLVILRKQDGKLERTDDLPVRFVPMVHGKDTGAKP